MECNHGHFTFDSIQYPVQTLELASSIFRPKRATAAHSLANRKQFWGKMISPSLTFYLRNKICLLIGQDIFPSSSPSISLSLSLYLQAALRLSFSPFAPLRCRPSCHRYCLLSAGICNIMLSSRTCPLTVTNCLPVPARRFSSVQFGWVELSWVELSSVRLMGMALVAWLECVSRQWVTPQFYNSRTDPIPRNRLSTVGRTANYTFWRRAQCEWVRGEGFLGLRLPKGRWHHPSSWLSFGLMLTNNDTAICRFHSTPFRARGACTSVSIYIRTSIYHLSPPVELTKSIQTLFSCWA